MGDVAIRVEGLGKRYRIGARQARYRTLRETVTDLAAAPFRQLAARRPKTGDPRSPVSRPPSANHIWALKDVSFEVKRGEVVGIIGRNGAGKSTLLKILSHITEPTEGSVDLSGRVGSLLEVGTGFHPELTGRENVYLNGAILGMGRAEIDRKFDEIVAFAEVEQFIDTPVKHYSSGMQVRLAFSVAAHLETDILLVDEVLAVGDIEFQRKCLGKMGDVTGEGRTVLLVSHNMGPILELCETGILLECGGVQAYGQVAQVVRAYQESFQTHPREVRPSGGVWFGDVAVGDNADPVIRAGQPARLAVDLGLPCSLSGFSLFCIVCNSRGDTVVHARVESRDLGYDGQRRYRATLQLPSLWLNPGLYTAQFKVLLQGALGSKGRYLSDATPFSVIGAASPTSSVLNPPASWSLQPGAGATNCVEGARHYE